MCFANTEGGMEINLDKIKCDDIVKILFAENPGVVIQVADKHKAEVKKILEDAGVGYVKIGVPTEERHILATLHDATYQSVSTTCVMYGILLLTCSTASRA